MCIGILKTAPLQARCSIKALHSMSTASWLVCCKVLGIAGAGEDALCWCRMPIDIMRVDTGDGQHRFAACVASYGYMGDLMRFSEKLRWMGPSRYNTAGTFTLLRGRAYRARVSYRPIDARR